jgi:hypothetical protein
MERAYALQPAEGNHILMLGTDIRVLAGKPTNASFSLLAIDLPAGQGPHRMCMTRRMRPSMSSRDA